jgi:hypothetical protein
VRNPRILCLVVFQLPSDPGGIREPGAFGSHCYTNWSIENLWKVQSTDTRNIDRAGVAQPSTFSRACRYCDFVSSALMDPAATVTKLVN